MVLIRLFSLLEEAPEDLEQQAVTSKLDAAQEHAEEGLCKMLDDHLDDTLMPPWDMIVSGFQNMVPQLVESAKAKLDSVSSLPCFAICAD